MIRRFSIFSIVLLCILSLAPLFGQATKKEYEDLKTRIIRSTDPDESIDLILKAFPIMPDDETESEKAALYIKLGGAYYTKKNYLKAIESFQKALEIEPTNLVAERNLVNTYTQIGNEHVRMKNYDLALENYDKARKLDPANDELPGRIAQANYNYGVQLYRQRNYNEAINEFMQCTKVDTTHKAGWYMLSLSYKRIDDTEGSNQAAIQATEIDPKYDLAWKQLALNYEAQKDYAKAIPAFQKYLELKPDDADMNLKLALNRADSGDLPGAIKELEGLVERNPANAMATYQLGDLLQTANRFQESYRQFKKIESDANLGANARKMLKYLEQKMDELGIEIPT